MESLDDKIVEACSVNISQGKFLFSIGLDEVHPFGVRRLAPLLQVVEVGGCDVLLAQTLMDEYDMLGVPDEVL